MTAKHFTVCAERNGEPRSETRNMATSALLLANRLIEQGYENIRLTDKEGFVQSRDAFKKRIKFGSPLKLEPRSAVTALDVSVNA